ncbi:unnamed protein product [Psylliodes chrysocephalus]|uniref:Uncharacterized protein n=1 Tax=Psylliodes chrysocephalus TaxID=3402493 RepID=A0A9P0G6S2_9CUCU|nr:unnamed protein product [Psylliodes chrysocephala]
MKVKKRVFESDSSEADDIDEKLLCDHLPGSSETDICTISYTADNLTSIFGEQQSNFRNIKDDILQYVCGKRTEVINLRRKHHTISNLRVAPLLKKIPPSITYLYEEEKLEVLRREHFFWIQNTENFQTEVKPQKVPEVSQQNTFYRQNSEKSARPRKHLQQGKETFCSLKRSSFPKDRNHRL